jgi:hypothetical protein
MCVDVDVGWCSGAAVCGADVGVPCVALCCLWLICIGLVFGVWCLVFLDGSWSLV